MSDEWNLNEEQVSGQNTESDAEPQILEKKEPTDVSSDIDNNAGNDSEQQETYHWVNPEYQKRQQGTADAGDNTYESNS